MKKTMHTELTASQYLPEALFERLYQRLGVKSYSALGQVIGLSPSVVSKVRNRKVAISSEILLKIHDATDIPLRELRRWMGDTRPFYSPLTSSVIKRPVKSAAEQADAELSDAMRAGVAASGGTQTGRVPARRIPEVLCTADQLPRVSRRTAEAPTCVTI